MAKFYSWSNNGVVAVVTEAVFQEMEHRRQIAEEARKQGRDSYLPPAGPVFTFSDSSHPALREWLTGTIEDMEVLLKGHEMVRKSFYVPFSNGIQWSTQGEESAKEEGRFRTTLREAMDAFGFVPRHSIASERPAKIIIGGTRL